MGVFAWKVEKPEVRYTRPTGRSLYLSPPAFLRLAAGPLDAIRRSFSEGGWQANEGPASRREGRMRGTPAECGTPMRVRNLDG